MRIRTFSPLRPAPGLASGIASPPYDVIDSDQARVQVQGNPMSWLHVVKPEVDLPEDVDLYADSVYAKAKENFQLFQQRGWMLRDPQARVYLYQQSYLGHVQTGLVTLCHTSDYQADLIRKHERTLQKKEDDRTRHVAALRANAGPVFLMYRDLDVLNRLMDSVRQNPPDVDFTSPDGVRHTTWPVPTPEAFVEAFQQVPCVYVADGHHRAASAARCSVDMAAANPNHTGNEDYNWFLCVLFPANELQILPYNRLVADLNGLSTPAFLQRVSTAFNVEDAPDGVPSQRADIRMFLDNRWYRISRPPEPGADPVAALDVSILQNALLSPVLGIDDPRTDARIRFKGGFNCVAEMQDDVHKGKAAIAFSLFPTSTDEVMAVADAGMIMPPKSTWFEPKLRSGLFVHTLDS